MTAYTWPRCPRCRQPLTVTDFGPVGRVWASTVVRIAVTDRVPPYRLAYVDLEEGPRVLVHLAGEGDAVPVGTTVRLAGRTVAGDVLAEVCS